MLALLAASGLGFLGLPSSPLKVLFRLQLNHLLHLSARPSRPSDHGTYDDSHWTPLLAFLLLSLELPFYQHELSRRGCQ